MIAMGQQLIAECVVPPPGRLDLRRMAACFGGTWSIINDAFLPCSG
jgi:hypothetical protein